MDTVIVVQFWPEPVSGLTDLWKAQGGWAQQVPQSAPELLVEMLQRSG